MSADQDLVDMDASSQDDSAGPNFDNLPKKPLSAYFMFLAGNRARVAAAAKAEGKTLTAANMASVLGKEWKAQAEDERKKWTDIHATAKEEYAAALKARGLDEAMIKAHKASSVTANTKKGGKSKAMPAMPAYSTAANVLQVGTVKRIIGLDPEVSRTSADSVKMITKATELFVHCLAQKIYMSARLHKRGTVKAPDFYQTLHDDSTFEFMRAPMPTPDALGEAMSKHGAATQRLMKRQKVRPEGGGSKASKAGKEQDKEKAQSDITAMFGKMTELSGDYLRSPRKSPSKKPRSKFAGKEELPAGEVGENDHLADAHTAIGSDGEELDEV